MIIEEITTTAFQQHTRVVGCERTRRAICIDPGDDSNAIVEAIDRHGFELQAIACTHAHMDHVGGVAGLKKRKPDAKIIIHAADEPIYTRLAEQPACRGREHGDPLPGPRWRRDRAPRRVRDPPAVARALRRSRAGQRDGPSSHPGAHRPRAPRGPPEHALRPHATQLTPARRLTGSAPGP